MEKRLRTAWQNRQQIALTSTAYRLVNGRGDGIPGLTVDVYGGNLQIQVFQREGEAALPHLWELLQEMLHPEFAVLKRRTDPSGASLEKVVPEILCGSAERAVCQVQENGLVFQVDLLDAVNSGLFLDMRDNRKRVANLAKGKKAINLFSYTCSFGVYCRAAGAAHVANADISQKILDRGRINYQLNSFALGKGEFFRGDSREYIAWRLKKQDAADLIVLDPPTFAHGPQGTWKIEQDLHGLLSQCFSLLSSQGYFFVSTNCSSIDHRILLEHLEDAALQAGRRVVHNTPLGQGADFPGSGSMKESSLAAYLVQVD